MSATTLFDHQGLSPAAVLPCIYCRSPIEPAHEKRHPLRMADKKTPHKTPPQTALALAMVFGAAALTGVGATLIYYFSNLQGWFFTRVW